MSIEELKADILRAQQNSDIASLFMLEQKAQSIFDEETLQAFYANILDLALDRLTDALEIQRVMDMGEVQDFATLRALYEYAMEHYSADKISDASALFEVLSGLSNDKIFSSSLKFHWIASREMLSLDDFLSSIADIDRTESAGTFYISCFQKEAQSLLDEKQTNGSK